MSETEKRVLLTFSGKHGDILWSLEAARAMALTGVQVHFGVMPIYQAVIPLIAIQPYISSAFPLQHWDQQHANFGAQPRIPPWIPEGYDEVHHLTYEAHPTEPLVLYAINRLGLPMPDPPVPFLFAPADPDPALISYAFNGQNRGVKEHVLSFLKATLHKIRFENVEALPFDQAARVISSSRFFFGCRSANYVVATGLGKRCLTVEPDGGRRQPVFGCPFARESMPEPHLRKKFADVARQWMEEPCD